MYAASCLHMMYRLVAELYFASLFYIIDQPNNQQTSAVIVSAPVPNPAMKESHGF